MTLFLEKSINIVINKIVMVAISDKGRRAVSRDVTWCSDNVTFMVSHENMSKKKNHKA